MYLAMTYKNVPVYVLETRNEEGDVVRKQLIFPTEIIIHMDGNVFVKTEHCGIIPYAELRLVNKTDEAWAPELKDTENFKLVAHDGSLRGVIRRN